MTSMPIPDIVFTIVADVLKCEPCDCAAWRLEETPFSSLPDIEAGLDVILTRIGREIGLPNFANDIDRQCLRTLGDIVRAAEIAQQLKLRTSSCESCSGDSR